MKEWHFYDSVYRRWVVLMIGPFEAIREEMKRNGLTQMEYIVDSKGLTIELNDDNNTTGQRCIIVWLKEYETLTLVHEITHLVMMCFTQCGVPISRENTEAYAFYTEYWFRQFTNARRKYPKGRTATQAVRAAYV